MIYTYFTNNIVLQAQ